MFGTKKLVARVVAGVGLAICSVVGIATPAFAGTVTAAGCLAGGGEIIDHGAWVGCHGDGFGSSGTKIVG
ncbi:MAG TPA: hypothetical protein VF519_06550 [Mycobacteriales bacterium]|jgi:hypothetical protein